MQQRVVERLATVFGGLDEHLQVLYHLLLAAEVCEGQRAECVLEVFLALRESFFAYVKILVHHTIRLQNYEINFSYEL